MPAEVDTAQGLLAEARRALANRRVHDALQLCDRAALQSDDGRYEAARLRGDILLDLGDAKGALSSFDSVADPEVADPSLDCARGLALFELARLAEAENALRSAVRGDADLAEAHFTLGLIAELEGTGEENEHFRRARKLSPERFRPAGRMSTGAFEHAVAAAVVRLPEAVRQALAATPVLIADLPNPRDLVRHPASLSPMTFAMRVAIRALGDPIDDVVPMKPALLLFKRNIERAYSAVEDVVDAVERTLREEFGEDD